MLTLPRRHSSSLLRSSLPMRRAAHLPQPPLFAAKGSLSAPRPSCDRNPPLRFFNSGSAPSGVAAARYSSKSRGRILHRCRSTTPNHPACFTASLSFPSLTSTPQRRAFSRTPIAMTATKIDGTAIAKKIRERLHAEIVETQNHVRVIVAPATPGLSA